MVVKILKNHTLKAFMFKLHLFIFNCFNELNLFILTFLIKILLPGLYFKINFRFYYILNMEFALFCTNI